MERDGHTGVPGVEPGEVVGAGELPGMGRPQPPRISSAAAQTDEQRTVLEVYSRTHAGLVPDAIQAVLASHDALLGCLEEAADWLDADLAHAPVTTTSMADRELVQRWRAALERAV